MEDSSQLTRVVLEGDAFVLPCNATGVPAPAVTWFKDGQPLTSHEAVQLTDSGRVLNFSSVELGDSGKYTCHATSKVGSARATFHVQVQGESFFNLAPIRLRNLLITLLFRKTLYSVSSEFQ